MIKHAGIAVLLAALGVLLLLATRERGVPVQGVRNELLPVHGTPGSTLDPELYEDSTAPTQREPAPGTTAAAEALDERFDAETRRVDLRVVDQRTGEALPEFSFDVLEPRRVGSAVVTSGAEGELSLELDAEADGARLAPYDHPELRPAWAWTEPHRVVAGGDTVRVPVGPTYRVRVLGADTAEARLRVRDRLRPTRATSPSPLRRSAGEDWGEGEGWVRFGPDAQETLSASGGPWILEAWTREKFGEAAVERILGGGPEVVTILLEARAAIRVLVRASTGAPLAGAQTTLMQDGRWLENGNTDALGGIRFEGLLPGSYVVEVRWGLLERRRGGLTLLAAERASVDFSLEVPVGSGRLAGELRSRSGTYQEPVSVWVRSLGAPGAWSTRIAWSSNELGELVGSFELDPVPPGDYELEFVPDDEVRVEPRFIRTLAPVEGLGSTIEDLEPTDTWRFTAADARTGDALEDFQVQLACDDRSSAHLAREGSVEFTSVPARGPVRWRVEAPGYRPLREGSTLHHRTFGRVEVEVRLEPGWGKELRIIDLDGRPIPGVEVVADGVPLGSSDARGRVDLEADARPSALMLRSPIWAIALGDVAADGSYRDLNPWIQVVMGPR